MQRRPRFSPLKAEGEPGPLPLRPVEYHAPMPERIDLTYEVTRADWLAVNEARMRESPAWDDAKARYRRTMRKQALWLSPLVIAGAAVLVGRDQGTGEMYLAGAGLGACFAAFLFFALPRLDTVENAKKAQFAQLQRADFSAYTGTTTLAVDELGVHVRSPSRELKLSWQTVSPAGAGGFAILRHGGQDGTIIPPRAFASQEAAAEFLDTARRWWQAAQLPHAERLARYLADRDLPCPKCKYNLRGVRSEKCPECGAALNLESLAGP